MGSTTKFDFPAVMVTKNIGDAIKAAMKTNQEIVFNFSPGKIISREDLIDTMTNFSSRGPRSIDSLIKPEVSGPGQTLFLQLLEKVASRSNFLEHRCRGHILLGLWH